MDPVFARCWGRRRWLLLHFELPFTARFLVARFSALRVLITMRVLPVLEEQPAPVVDCRAPCHDILLHVLRMQAAARLIASMLDDDRGEWVGQLAVRMNAEDAGSVCLAAMLYCLVQAGRADLAFAACKAMIQVRRRLTPRCAVNAVNAADVAEQFTSIAACNSHYA